MVTQKKVNLICIEEHPTFEFFMLENSEYTHLIINTHYEVGIIRYIKHIEERYPDFNGVLLFDMLFSNSVAPNRFLTLTWHEGMCDIKSVAIADIPKDHPIRIETNRRAATYLELNKRSCLTQDVIQKLKNGISV